MSHLIIIPARFGSTRFPGKPLAKIGDKPLIEHTWRAAAKTGLDCLIATDDRDIEDMARDFGAEVIMTGECANGTERCAQALELSGDDPEIVINWQGDSPLCPQEFALGLIDELERNPRAYVSTPIQSCDDRQMMRLRADAKAGIKGATMAAITDDGRALYFSKSIIPQAAPWWFHIGLYAYRADTLRAYGRKQCQLENQEGLEQLRFLDRGVPIHCVPVGATPIWEINNPGDVQIVEGLLCPNHEKPNR